MCNCLLHRGRQVIGGRKVLIDILNNVRNKEESHLNVNQRVIQFLLLFLIGITVGFVSKYIEGVPHYGQVGDLLNIIGNICTGIGIWTFIATIISAWSRSPNIAGLNVFLFFSGLLLAYYLYSMKLFGFFPTYYFLRWGAIAICSPLAAYFVWYARGEGWIAAMSAALLIGLLAEQGYGYFSILSGFSLIAAIVLLVLLPKRKIQIIRIIPLAIIVAFVLEKFNILSYIIGGL